LDLENKRKDARTLKEAAPALQKIRDKHTSERLRKTAAKYLRCQQLYQARSRAPTLSEGAAEIPKSPKSRRDLVWPWETTSLVGRTASSRQEFKQVSDRPIVDRNQKSAVAAASGLAK
jgi:hypothetical protein